MNSENWWLIDAENKTLGRLAAMIAARLRGKFRADFAPNLNFGEHIVVVNAAKIRVTGKKMTDKIYYRHSGHIGNLKQESFGDLQARAPGKVLELAVKGMLPKNPLGRRLFTQLKVYAGIEHPHSAQQPKPIEVKEAE